VFSPDEHADLRDGEHTHEDKEYLDVHILVALVLLEVVVPLLETAAHTQGKRRKKKNKSLIIG